MDKSYRMIIAILVVAPLLAIASLFVFIAAILGGLLLFDKAVSKYVASMAIGLWK